MPVCAGLQDVAILVDQHRARQVARGGARGQQLAKRSAILVEQRPGVGDIVGHAENVAANELRVLVQIGVGDDQRVLDHLARRAGKQPVEAAIDGDVGDDRHQHRRQHRDDREQADDLDVQPRRRPAAAPGLHHLPDFADDDADQQQDGRGIDQQERTDDLAGRLDRRQAGQHHEGQEGRQQRQADGKRRQPPAAGTTPWVRRATDRTMGPRCLRWSFRQGGELKACNVRRPAD